MKCKIADFNITINNKDDMMTKSLADYTSDFENEDYLFTIHEQDIEFERVSGETTEHRAPYLEFIAILRKIGELLPSRNAFVLHSACFDVDGVGVAFAAHSGTGKTTHMNRWIDYLGDRLKIVNGDKPIVRFFDDEPEQPYAYGTPWRGKECLGCNMRTPIKHICFIERSETNYVEPLDKKEAIDRIFNQVYMPKNPIAVMNTMQLIDRLLSCCNLWIIHCNMEDNAAEIAYKTIFGK